MIRAVEVNEDWSEHMLVCDVDGCGESFCWSNGQMIRLIAQCDNGWGWRYAVGEKSFSRVEDLCPSHR